MNEIEFANAFLGEYRIHGDELIPMFCPFCGGGDSRDKNTFALSRTNHTYNCKRGSCGSKGTFVELCRKYGVNADNDGQTYIPTRHKSVFKPSQTKINEVSEVVLQYLNLRKIEKSTIEAFGIGSDGNGNIIFPYYRTSDDYKAKHSTFVKFRPARKVAKGERKMWREKDTEPILFGLHLCKPSGTLFICEGEIDCMSIWQSTEGTVNIVSVPSGAEDFTWLETCENEIAAYDSICVLGDADAPGKKMADDIANKLPDKRILFPDYETYRNCKDANEILYKYGAEAFTDIFAAIKEKPVIGLVNIADISDLDPTEIPRVITGFPVLDYSTGGLFFGDLDVITGKRGGGKSTIVNQFCLNIIEQECNVCVYSGEIPAERFKYTLMLCAAGAGGLLVKTDKLVNREVFLVKPEIRKRIESHITRRLWLYDNSAIEDDESLSVFNLFITAFRRYNCRAFVVDNLMSLSASSKASEYWQNQANFIIKLRKFAMRYNVLVLCIVHPRKTKSGETQDADDVGGMSAITDIASNVFSLTRYDGDKAIEKQCSAELCVFKNRFYSDKGNIKLNFDLKSRRYTEVGKTTKKFAWEDVENWQELSPDQEIPF